MDRRTFLTIALAAPALGQRNRVPSQAGPKTPPKAPQPPPAASACADAAMDAMGRTPSQFPD
jgi:hypothetical protein